MKNCGAIGRVSSDTKGRGLCLFLAYSLKNMLIFVPSVDEKVASPITLKKFIPGCHRD